MILQALYNLAYDEKLLGDGDYEWKPVAWLIRLGDKGKLLGIESTRQAQDDAPGKGAKKKPVARNMLVPREAGRTSGDYAFFMFDKAEYVFGIDPVGEREAEKLALRAGMFRDKVKQCVDDTGDEGAKAVLAFLEDIHAGRQKISLSEECVSNDLFAFIYAPDIDRSVTDREKIRAYWKSLRVQSPSRNESSQRCLVSGQPCQAVDKHPSIKKVPGGTTSGVALVSFNANAFESYGLSGNENAPISRQSAEACSTALNRLLDNRPMNAAGAQLVTRNIRLSADTVVCFWTPKGKGDEFSDVFAPLVEANDPQQVKEMYRSIWRGRNPGIADPSAFYALTLSGAQGRAVVRDWFESTVAEVAAHLAQHFHDLDIVRNAPAVKDKEATPSIPKTFLFNSLAPQGKEDGIPASLAGEVIHAAIAGTEYPLGLLQRAIQRARAEVGKDDWADLQRRDARAALIKAVLNRRKRYRPQTTGHYKEITKAMDPTNMNPGYLLGRMMAVIERIQQLALNEVNAGVVDRFFSGASANPRAVFVRLLKNARFHVRKAKDDSAKAGFAAWLDRQLDEIAFNFNPKENGFPAFLELEQQGLFVLGYHHMRHWLWMKKEDRQALEADRSADAAKA